MGMAAHQERKKWYVVNSNSRAEQVVANQLRKDGYEVFLPRITRPSSTARPVYEEPLFPGYIFASFDPDSPEWTRIKYTPGVRKVLLLGGKPVPVPHPVMEAVREVTGKTRNQKTVPFRRGETVKFVEGPMAGLEGVFSGDVAGRDRVKILLTAVYWRSSVEVPLRSVKSAAGGRGSERLEI